MKKHYLVYQITNSINQKIYIGIHSTENIEDGYMGSGTHIRRAIKKYGIENFKKEILFDFDNPEEMILKESQIVDRKFIARKDVYNIKLGGEGWLTFDSISVKDNDGNCFRVHKTDDRYLNGELKGITSGKLIVKDYNGNITMVDRNDSRYLTGELRGAVAGTVVVKDELGKNFRISCEDYHKNKSNLISVNADKIYCKDTFGCYYMVYANDERINSGELIRCGTFDGRKHSQETILKMRDSKIGYGIAETNSQFGTCWIHSIELKKNKKIKKIELDSFLLKGWIKGRKMKF